jgi:DNA helicase HerA-like ATPase
MLKRKIVGVFGIQGMGKTTYIKQITKNLDRVLFVDTLEEFNYTTITNPKELIEYLKDRIKFKIEYVNIDDSDVDALEKVSIALKAYVQEMLKKYEIDIDITLVVDEVDIYSNSHFIAHHFSEVIRRGRHYNTNLIYATRRPHEAPRLATSQSNAFVIFKTIEPSDINFFKSFIGDYANEIPNLQRFEYLYCNLDENIVTKKKLTLDFL